MNKIKFNPEFNFGHIVYLLGVLVTVVVFWVKTDARLTSHEATLNVHQKQIENITTAQNLLNKNQAVLETLIQERYKRQ